MLFRFISRFNQIFAVNSLFGPFGHKKILCFNKSITSFKMPPKRATASSKRKVKT